MKTLLIKIILLNLFWISGCKTTTDQSQSNSSTSQTNNYSKNIEEPCGFVNYKYAIDIGTKESLKEFLKECNAPGSFFYKRVLSKVQKNKIVNPLSTSSKKVTATKKIITNSPKLNSKKDIHNNVNRTKEPCGFVNYKYAIDIGTKESLKEFLKECNAPGSFFYKRVSSKLGSVDVSKSLNIEFPQSNDKPKENPVISEVSSSSADISEKPPTIIIPTGSIGKISEARKKILEKTLESKLDNYFSIVPKDLFEEAREKAFEELDYEECTEEQCIVMIKEMLQVENSFQLVLIFEDGDTQVSLTWNDLDQKRVEEQYCEGCKTKQLRDTIDGLVKTLVSEIK